MPAGPLKRAAVSASPLALPVLPAPPATRSTVPVASVILRTMWLPYSVTYRIVPAMLRARSTGLLSVAVVPVPSAAPAVPLPAIVLTVTGLTPRFTLRMR